MNTAQPIRNRQELNRFMNYYKMVEVIPRNQLLIVMGANTALRVSDLLSLTWRDVYDQSQKKFRGHITLVEAKTGKVSCIFVNKSIQNALREDKKFLEEKKFEMTEKTPLFQGREGASLSRVQAYRIIRKAAEN